VSVPTPPPSTPAVSVDVFELAVLGEQAHWNYVYANWDNTMDLRAALLASLKNEGYDDADARRLSEFACEKWARGEGSVNEATRLAARQSLAAKARIAGLLAVAKTDADRRLAHLGISYRAPTEGLRSGEQSRVVASVNTPRRADR